MSFRHRSGKGGEAASRFKALLSKYGVPFAEVGHETLTAHPAFKSELQQQEDVTGLRLRFMPDFAVILRGTHLFELKCSTGIERDAYEAYLELQSLGYSVVLAFYREKRFSTCRPDKLVFESPLPMVYGMSVPVEQGVWRTPRKLATAEYREYIARASAKGQDTSGCAFAFIDFSKTPLRDFEAWLERYSSRELAA